MLVRVRDTGAVMYLPQWEQTFPETSFPNPIPVETLNEFGADVVLDGPYPTCGTYQYVISGPVIEQDGVWYTSFIVEDMDQEAKDAVDAALKQSNKDKAAKLLDETDWTQVADCPLLNKQEFIDYRAVVRAIALNPTIDAVFPELPANQWI